jgi:hypothetical protein
VAPEQPPLDRQVQVQLERLIDEDERHHSPEEIERLAREAAAQHADAPVQQFVPNLVYNAVKSQLVKDTQLSAPAVQTPAETLKPEDDGDMPADYPPGVLWRSSV